MGNNFEIMEKFRDHPAGQGTEQWPNQEHLTSVT